MSNWQARLLDAGAGGIFVLAIVDTFVRPTSLPYNALMLGFALMVALAYVSHLFVVSDVAGWPRTLWTIALIVFAPVAVPLYWWFYLAPEVLRAPARPPRPLARQVADGTADEALNQIAVVGIPWEEFGTRYGVVFRAPGATGPDAPAGRAVIQLASGERFGLEHHGDEPYPAVLVLGRLEEDLDGQRRRFAAGLGLPHGAFRYIRDADSWRDARTGDVVT